MAVRRGVILVFALIFIAVLVSMAGMVFLALFVGSPVSVPSNSTLYLSIKTPLAEVPPSDVFSQLIERPATLAETIDAIHKAQRDSRVKALVIRPSGSGALWGQLQDIRAAVEQFRATGKPVTAFLESGTAQDYYLATAADQIVLMPAGQLDLTGIATYELFFGGALEKLGVQPDLLHIGDYKTAANTFTERSFTKAHREMAQSLNRDWYDELVRAISAGRKKTVEDVRRLIDDGPFLADAAKQAGLVDRVAYDDQLDDERPIAGTQRLDAADYARADVNARSQSGRIAVLYAVGTIASGASSNDSTMGAVLGSDTFNSWLRAIRVDPSIRAVVVRIDSPGGSAVASEAIWRELMLTRERLPVIVSMGDVAASGGYYIAAPAHAIVAEAGTLTGSIGVVTGKFTLTGGLDKLGVGTGSVSDGRFAEIYSPFRPFTAAERKRIEAQMQATYDIFLARVADGRKSTREQIDAIGRGRVWTGRQARERGLVDEIGGLETALRLAKERAKLDPARAVELAIYPEPPSVFDLLSNPFGLTGASVSREITQALPAPADKAVQSASRLLRRFRPGEMLTLLPNVFVR